MLVRLSDFLSITPKDDRTVSIGLDDFCDMLKRKIKALGI